MRQTARFLALIGLFGSTDMLWAQESEAPAEVVLVTGFKPERLDDAAGSTSVIDTAIIEGRAAQHVETVVGAAANVTMTSGASRGRFVQMRGIGDLEQFVDPKHYPSVGVSIDGIDVGGIGSAAMLFDVQQVEVLRGPQGTRFGSGALAGQVNIVSNDPEQTFGGYLDAGLGSYGSARIGVAAGGPLTDSLAGRIAVQLNRGDGYVDNAWLGLDDSNGYDESMLRAKLAWRPMDAAELEFTALRFDNENGYDAFSLDNTRTTLSDQPGRDDLDLSALGLRALWTLESGGSIEAVLNWLDSEIDYGFDEDWTYVGICDGTLCDPVFDYFSNTDRYVRERGDRSLDLRWLGQWSASSDFDIDYVVGVYLQDREESLARQYYGPFASRYSAERSALYGQVQLPITERAEITLGFRHEAFDDGYSDSFAFASSSDDKLSSGELAFDFELDDASHFYAILSQGMKPGGVNTEANSVFPLVQQRFQDYLAPRLTIRKELLRNTEIGIKNSFSGGRLELRASLFRMAREDAQIESWFWDPVNFLWVGVLDNVDGENLGAEVDFDYRPSSSWRLHGSIGLLSTEVDALTTFDLNLDDFVVREGIDQTKAPSWQIYLGSRWQFESGWGFDIDLDSTDSHRYGYYHDAEIGRSTVVNANLKRDFMNMELSLWVRNIFDEDRAIHGLYFGNDPRKAWVPEQYLQLGEPRIAGVSVRRWFQ